MKLIVSGSRMQLLRAILVFWRMLLSELCTQLCELDEIK